MSKVGQEIAEAAEAEMAKGWENPVQRHWQRRDDAQTVDSYQDSVVATACGRLVGDSLASAYGEKTDCRECAEVYFIVHPPSWVHSGI